MQLASRRLIADIEIRRDAPSDVLVVASSGGHLTQALLALPETAEFHLVTNRVGVAPCDERILTVLVPRFDTHRNPVIHAANVRVAEKVQRWLGIRRTFTTGGAIALPFAAVSRLRRQPFVYLDTLSRVEDISSTCRLVVRLRLASAVFSQWPDLAARYPGVRHAGAIAPVRGLRDE
jgi:hypothetical protein